MFTGIIEAIGTISLLESTGGDKRLHVDAGALDLSDVKLGDSISVSGVCLTAIKLDSKSFTVDVSGETLAYTTLGSLIKGDCVNLEKALTISSRLGGHMVSGHVDAVGEITARDKDARSIQFQLAVPKNLIKYIARKGSICVDGISLTVNEVDEKSFSLNIIPHTLDQTTMKEYVVGRRVNLEVDIVARYIEQLLSGESVPPTTGISADLLKQYGYLDR